MSGRWSREQADEVFKRLHKLASPDISIKVKPIKGSKYRNVKTQVNGITFDSRGEAERYLELIQLERAGVILELRLQVSFELAPPVMIHGKRKKAWCYIADFVYVQDGRRVVEDFKGVITAEYVAKRHMMKHVHGIDIYESKKRRARNG